MTDRMVAWLREALGAARYDAEMATPGPWVPRPLDQVTLVKDRPELTSVGIPVGPAIIHAYGGRSATDARHIARHDPEAVLRRIAGDRKQLAEHAPVPDHGRFSHSYGETCPAFCEGECRNNPKVCLTCRDSSGEPIEAPCRSLEFLAESWGWTEAPPKPDWPECMCTPTGECGKCWEKRQETPSARATEGDPR